jgi:hypothetical protein
MTNEISFDIPNTPGNKAAFEELMATDGVETIYIEKQNGELFPVARVERHPDCPKVIYEAWKRTLFNYDQD